MGQPWSLQGGDSVTAKVSATNIYGESEQSLPGNGAIYTHEPDAPVNLAEDVA